MERTGDTYSIVMPSISRVIPSLEERSHIVEEPFNPRSCPLCQADIRLFFINFNEKMVMCENTECEFPFGFEELQFYKVDDGEPLDTIINSNSAGPSTPIPSCITSVSLSDVEKNSEISEQDSNSQMESRAMDVKEYLKKPIPKEEKVQQSQEKTIDNQLNEMKQLSKKYEPKRTLITNQKWLQELMEIQGTSKKTLVDPVEMSYIQNKKIDNKEIKIDVKTEPGQPMITIDLSIDNSTV